jgi:molybdenum cofactor synthesis domain-containing protein
MLEPCESLTVDMEIICVGNELLIGKTLNTNAFWMGKQATTAGVNVKRITVVQDIIEEIAQVIREALERKPRFIVMSGGLGPTFDDKTLQGVAKALGRKLEVNPKALDTVKTRYVEYAKKKNQPIGEMTPARVKMATFPEGTEPVCNPAGTAPALRADVDGTVLFALPGVPAEMEAIFTQTIEPALKQAVGNRVFAEESLFLQNIMESNLAPLIDEVMNGNKGVYIKSHPMGAESRPHIEIHLTASATKEEKPMEKVQNAKQQLACLVEENGGKAWLKEAWEKGK